MTLTDLIIRRTLTVDHINPSLTAAVLTGARRPLSELAELEGRDVVVMTLAELQAVALEATANGARIQLSLEQSANAGLD